MCGSPRLAAPSTRACPDDEQLRRLGRRRRVAPAARGSRPAYFGASSGGWTRPSSIAPSLDRARPRRGPLIVEEYDATTVVPPGCSATLDAWGNIVIDIQDEG